MHSIIIAFLIVLLEEYDKEENLAVTGAVILPVQKYVYSKIFCPMSRVLPVTARPTPQR